MEDDGTLSIGTRLGEFEIRGLVGIGGFGIVYRAFDHDLEREVAIKEYMPGLLASRTVDGQVQARGRTHAETFEAGRRSFMLEAKMLARFDHPALVKVFRFWEGNGTAYMVMPLYTGQTLAQVLKQMPAPPTEVWLMGVLVPLLGALEALHSQQIFHRDVSPDNILLLRNGRPVLLDFGAARQVISDRTQTLTAILKPNYAPIEQYAEVPNLRQGPWTDLYALGAVVYASLTGKPPTPAAARTVQDDLVPLAEVAARIEAEHGQRYSAAFLDAWQQTLAVHPNDRPQSVRELMQRLGLMPSAIAADDDATVIAPLTRAPARLPDNDHTVVVTGLPAHTVAPSPRTGLSTTTSVPTGRDMRMVAPVTGHAHTAGRPTTEPGASGLSAPQVTQDSTHRTTQRTTHAPTTRPPQSPPPAEAGTPSAPAPADALAPLEKPATGSHGLKAVALAGLLGVGVLGYLMTRQPSGPATGSAPAPSAALAASAALASAPSTDTVSTASRSAMVIIDEAPERPVTSASAPSDLLLAASAPAPASAPDKATLAAAKASAAAAKASAAAAKLAARQAASQATANGALSNLPPTGAGPAPATPHVQVATPSAASSHAPARTLDDLCGKRNFLFRDSCIQDACQTPEFSRTGACVDLRRKAEEERIRTIHTDG